MRIATLTQTRCFFHKLFLEAIALLVIVEGVTQGFEGELLPLWVLDEIRDAEISLSEDAFDFVLIVPDAIANLPHHSTNPTVES